MCCYVLIALFYSHKIKTKEGVEGYDHRGGPSLVHKRRAGKSPLVTGSGLRDLEIDERSGMGAVAGISMNRTTIRYRYGRRAVLSVRHVDARGFEGFYARPPIQHTEHATIATRFAFARSHIAWFGIC